MGNAIGALPTGALQRIPPVAGTLRQQFGRVLQQRLTTHRGQIAAGNADVREQAVIEFGQPSEHLPSFDDENDSPEVLQKLVVRHESFSRPHRRNASVRPAMI